ncbi:MAG: hypothetical protein ACK49I_04745 [Verrucomicrobiota bacterium]
MADRTAHDMELYSMAVGVGCPGGLTLASGKIAFSHAVLRPSVE